MRFPVETVQVGGGRPLQSKGGDKMRKYLLSAVAASAVIAGSNAAIADEAAAQRWIDQEFQPSTLSKD